MKRCLVAAVCSCVSLAASGQITAFDFVDVDNSAGGSALDGFTTTDITVDFDSRWTGSQMLIQLTKGSIYQNDFGGDGPPSGLFTTFQPALAFDTFVTLNARTSEELPDDVEVFAGAVNLGGNPELTFDENVIDAAWVYFPPLPFPPDYFPNFQDQDDFLISRVTLSDDAEGTFVVLASAGGVISVEEAPLSSSVIAPQFATAFSSVAAAEDDDLLVAGTIQGGTFVVPEPAAGLALLGLPYLAMRRRRSA